jgi:hypothetical protein
LAGPLTDCGDLDELRARAGTGDPAGGVNPAEPVDHFGSARRAGQRHRTARARPSRAAAGAGTRDNGGTGRVVMATSRAGGGCAAGDRRP